MKIAVVGTGYVGLVTGTCFAETGNHVTCVDIDERKVEQMKAGKMPIFEPGLDRLFERNIRQGRLSFTTNLAEGIEGAEVIFLALPTPPGEDGSADLKYILGVADDLGIPHERNPSHIIPVMVGDPVKCKYISDLLMAEHGIYIQPINYPTVPMGTERLRITPSPLHSQADIDHLISALGALWTQCELARMPLAAQ